MPPSPSTRLLRPAPRIWWLISFWRTRKRLQLLRVSKQCMGASNTERERDRQTATHTTHAHPTSPSSLSLSLSLSLSTSLSLHNTNSLSIVSLCRLSSQFLAICGGMATCLCQHSLRFDAANTPKKRAFLFPAVHTTIATKPSNIFALLSSISFPSPSFLPSLFVPSFSLRSYLFAAARA